MSDSTLQIVLDKSAAICTPMEVVIQIARQNGVDWELLKSAAHELDRYRQIEIKAQDVLRSARDRTRKIDNLAHTLNKKP